MAGTLKQQDRHSRYRLRKQVVEPVFSQIKQARGFRQFLLRGFDKGPPRMGDDLHLPQPPQAGPGQSMTTETSSRLRRQQPATGIFQTGA